MPSLTDVLPSACAHLGAAGFLDTLDLRERAGDARRLVVVVVDGLGHRLLHRSPALAALAAEGSLARLRCTLPSTTPTSLVSLGTGAEPGRHGVLGFTVHVPGTDRVLTHIAWRDEPDPRSWQPLPTVFERAAVASAVVLPEAFLGSGLTRAAYRGAEPVGVKPGAGLVKPIVSALDRSPLVVGYVSDIDTAAHVHGIASEQWQSACSEVAVLLEQLVDRLPPDAALLVTADHGGLDVPAERRVDLGADERLRAGLRVVAGEPRLRYLHVVPGALDDVVAVWREVLGARADVLVREEAVAAGLFGTVTDAHRPRIGDVVVVCRDDSAVLATGYEPDEVSTLVGMHGAATDAETDVPLLVLRPGR